MASLELKITKKQRRAEVFGYFEYLDYTYEGELKDTDYWSGVLTIPLSKSSLVLKVLIGIDDWNFTTLPHLYLQKPLPKPIQKHVPLAHLQVQAFDIFGEMYYGFCYSLPDRNELPRLNPGKIIDYVFSQTASVLKELIENSEVRQSDLYREIEPTWHLLLENQKHIDLINLPFIFRPIKVKTITAKISFSIYDFQNKQLPFFLVKVDGNRIPPLRYLLPLPGLKGNWYSLCSWLNNWEKGLSEKLTKTMQKYGHIINRNKVFGVAVICNHAVLPMYFVDIDDLSILAGRIENDKKNKKVRNTFFIIAYPGIFISEDMLYQRNLVNLSQPDLINKKVLLIGCGAIGGYLGLSLVKIGAGAGESGVLSMIDNDIMGVHNTGRHLIGLDFIGLPKSKALEFTIKLQYPDININSVANSIFADQINLDQYIKEYDLIIDATGKIEVAETLNEYWQSIFSQSKATLQHVWISSNGECVQSLLIPPAEKKACRSCLRQAGSPFRNSEQSPLPNKTDTAYAFRACSDYTPYAVSASQSASALATDGILDWLRNQPHPLYRTRYTEKWQGDKIESSSPDAHPECPYCQGNQCA